MTKLNNIKAVKQLLDGVHRTQTKTKVTLKDIVSDSSKPVGTVWTDEAGVTWEQRHGYRIKKGKLDSLRDKYKTKVSLPTHCPKCKSEMINPRLDMKFWLLEGHCFNCQVEYEHQLRIEGKYENYEKERIRRNYESWLTEAEKEVTEIIEFFKNPVNFANSDGTIEKWSGGLNNEEVALKIQNEFAKFKDNFIKQLQ